MKILVSDLFSNTAIARLKANPKIELIQCLPKEVTTEKLKEISIWLLRSRTQVHKKLIDEAKNLKLVITSTSGFDHLDIEELKKRNIIAAYTPDANVESAASHTWTLLLALTRHLNMGFEAIKKQEWRESVPRGELLKGKTLGLMGLGRIGQRVAQMGLAFGMDVIAFDPYQSDEVFKNIERSGQAEVFRASDVLSLHVPLTKETFRMINHATLHNLNPDAYLINTSRGSVIEETELCEALDEGILRGVALDVFEREPLVKTSKLRGRKNVILSPHLGAYTAEALESASHQAVDQVEQFLSEKPVANTLPLTAPWYELIGHWPGKEM